MIHNYRKISCAQHKHATSNSDRSTIPLKCAWLAKETATGYLTFAIILTLASTCFAFQESANRPLRPTPDPYFNPKRQEFSSNPSLQQNLTFERTNSNPSRQTNKLAPLVSSTPEAKPFTSGNGAETGTDTQNVKNIPAWEPPSVKTPPASDQKGDLLKPLTAKHGVVGKQPSIIRNAGTITPPVVGDFSADLSNFKRLQPSGSAALKPAPETPPPGAGSAGEQASFPPMVKSPIAPQPSTTLANEDEKTFKPMGGGNDPIVQNKIQDSPFGLEKQSSFNNTDSTSGSNEVSLKEQPTDSGNDQKKPLLPDPIFAKPSQIEQNPPSELSREIEPTRLLAMVGNEPIFVGDMLFEINQMIDKFMPGAPQEIRERETKNAIPMLLGKFVDSKLLYVDTLRKLPEGVDLEKVLDQAGDEFDEKVVKSMMKESGSNTSADFEAHLRVQGTSLRKFRQTWCKDQLTRYFISEQLEEEKEVTHQELLDEYKNRIDEYAIPAKARWEQVTIRFDRTSSRKEAEQQIAEIGKKILHGATFAAIAKKESHGFTASDGGLHDWTNKGSLAAEELDQALFTLPIGKLSSIIETRDGFHIIRVTERTEATRKPFLEAQQEIKEAIQEKKRRDAFEKYVAKVRKDITVEYYIEMPKMATAQNPQAGTLVR